MRSTGSPTNINFGAHIKPGAPETLQAQRIEIEGVKRVHTPGHGWGIEVDNETPEFFSAYLRSKETGLAICVGDFEHYREAHEHADETKYWAGEKGVTLEISDGYLKHLKGSFDGSIRHRALAMATANYYSIDTPDTETLYAAYQCHLSAGDSDELPQWLQLCSAHEDASLEAIHEMIEADADFIEEHLQAVTAQAIHQLRLEGHAIVRFQPSELHGVEPRLLQNRLVELGNQAIEDLREDSPDAQLDDAGGAPTYR